MNSQKNINQQLASQGVTGGQSESTLLGLNTNYSDALRQGKQSETKAQSELDQAITQAKLAADKDIASSTAENAIAKANAYVTALQNAIAQANTMYQYQMAADSENKSYAYQYAMNMLNSGIMPDDSTLSNAGINKTDAQSIVNAYSLAANQNNGGYKGSNYGTGSNVSLDNAYAKYLAKIATSDDMNALYNEYGVTNSVELDKVLDEMGMKTPNATYTTFSQVYNNVINGISGGESKETVMNYLNDALQNGLVSSDGGLKSQYYTIKKAIEDRY